MVMNNATLNNGPRANARGPGVALAQARADLHLTHEEVAATLHLATHQIQSLEQDDYTSLPGSTYVRGYLKSYALLLGLAPGPILEAHARLAAVPTAPSLSMIAPKKEITSRHHQVRFVTYVVAFMVLGLAAAWWQSRDTRPPNPLLATDPVVLAPDAVPVTDEPSQAAMPVDEAPLVGASGTLTTPPAPVVLGRNTAPAFPALPPSVNEASVTVAPALPAPAPIVAAPLPTGPRANLVFRAEQDSWADIRDARQVKLLYETVPAGRTVTLEGVAPVNIFLGNAAGVRLDYNGKAVDIERHRRGMMARFTLGAGEAVVAPPR